MAEFKISRFRYTWKGVWTTGTTYTRDDVVRYNGSSYVCLRGHTASATIYDDINYVVPSSSPAVADPAWVLMTKGAMWKGDWLTGTYYSVGDIVLNGGITYICTVPHTSSTFSVNQSNWDTYITSSSWSNQAWAPYTLYDVGDIVRYGGVVYRCITANVSGPNDKLETASLNWQVYYYGDNYWTLWSATTDYKKYDLVKWGGSIWRANQTHTSGSTFESAKWDLDLPGYQFGGEWDPAIIYQTGDIVRWGGDLFYSNVDNNSVEPRDPIDSTIIWTKMAQGINLRGDYDPDAYYLPGDVIRRGGSLYQALFEVTPDASTLDYLSNDYWKVLALGDRWVGTWYPDTAYTYYDLVIYAGSTYRCLESHTSDLQNFPGDNGNGINLWELFISSGDKTSLTYPGDMATYALSRTLQGDGSTFGPTPLSIGDEDELLMVNGSSAEYYKKYGLHTNLVYVSSSTGVDREDYGQNPFRPWRTIRYACEQVESYTGNTTVHVTAGTYDEVLPIIVPAGVVIKGEETRAVVVQPKTANENLSIDSTYTIAVLNRIKFFVGTLILGGDVTVTSGNTTEQDKTITGGPSAGTKVSALIDDIIAYIDFHINSTGLEPTITGTNTLSTSASYINGALCLENNIQFIQDEIIAYMQTYYGSYVFDETSCRRDLKRYIEAFIYDLRYPGNYKSVWAARYYKNAVLGSETEDMFYLRDSTGVRNMTLTGLTGTLNPPGVYQYYQRPTGGAYCAFDPGWGPNDDRVWISTRSPYLQNCACFGYAATGQRLDGYLHNGGNKSFVSNDYTQIISDGLGAHVYNGARAELVSVFTYYAQVGYLAETGGIIRATNGNNSYGRYGAMSLGNDPTEVPRTARVNNRNNQAKVNHVLAGGNSDNIFVFGYENAGQNYSSASYTFVGAGIGASVIQEDFRDDAVFEAFINSGGGGYTYITKNAQTGDSTTITLALTDDNSSAQLVGNRIIIISGPGTGQYGYIYAYNSLTKIVTVYKESNDTPGWDHVVPGWPIETVLTTSTNYVIEPRPIFSAPEYSATTVTLPTTTNWANIAFGETNATYTGIAGSAGTGTVVGDDGLVPVTATWNVVKTGRSYTVTINNPGAGYQQGQTFIIPGTSLGGVSADNDITITVTKVSNDSTNSIMAFTYSGRAASGYFVAVDAVGSSTAYSNNGTTWSQGTLPSSGNWKCLAGNNGAFVTIKNASNSAAYSTDGITWTPASMPSSANWNGAAYGNNKFVAVADDLNKAAYSTDGGVTWNAATMPTFGDSTYNQWVAVIFGKNTFVAIANTGNVAATSSDGITWTGQNLDALADSTQVDWIAVAYGNNRFVAISSQGNVGYSFDGLDWYGATLPKQDGSTAMNWKSIRYGGGLFFAVCDTGSAVIGADPTTGPTTYAATSEDGVVWTEVTLASSASWNQTAFGNPDIDLGDSTLSYYNNTGMWIAIPTESTNIGNMIKTGARAKGRVESVSGVIDSITIWDPGSGYQTAPTLTFIDPNNTSDASIECRIADGVLGQPSWLNRGLGYRTASTSVTVSGNGFADMRPTYRNLTLMGLSKLPKAGSQLIFEGNSQIYTTVLVTDLGDILGDGTGNAYVQISPYFTSTKYVEHNTSVTIREKYSQCRITGHDYLDIGTGNFLETNYPEIYATGIFDVSPENEVVEALGGRVFYTSTDQNGNFRTGELFAVEQATGIVTISADFFNFKGLAELRLGGVRLGGSGVVIYEFSTDPLFSADSNNIVPTQRAIKSYLQQKLSVAGADLVATGFQAGSIVVGGDPPSISNAQGLTMYITVPTNFKGTKASVRGIILAQSMFFRSFKDDGQDF